MLPVVPQQVNELLQTPQGQASTYPFPPNVAELMPKDLRQKIMQWMLQTYIWPQVMERRPYEKTWDKLLDMARATWQYSDADIDENTRQARARQQATLDGKIIEGVNDDQSNSFSTNNRLKVADTVIFDAVDRLTNLNHFIAFKEEFPVRYELPSDVELANENDVYSPMSALVKSANAWLKFNATNQDVYRKGWMTARHHYTYGVSFVDSQFNQKTDIVQRRLANGSWMEVPELTDIGVSFEPISIRKLWLNYRLSVYKMDYQPCPFFFEEMPRFAIIANQYDPIDNPMGFVNQATLSKAEYLFSSPETHSLEKSLKSVYPDANLTLSQLMDPMYNVELLWTMYPMLPLQISQGPDGQPKFDWLEMDNPAYLQQQQQQQQTNNSLPPSGPASTAPTKIPVPLQRYVISTFGNNLVTGNQEIVKLQRNFYPNDSLPIYGSAHMPTLDDGAYPAAIGTVLEGHYRQICKALDQYLLNKDWINDPPTDIMTSSPSMTRKDINKPGSRNPVNGINDINRRAPYDQGGTTLQFLQFTREQAQTSSKSTDAILGKAMGSRTSATEASNVYQTAMSGITTDVNLFTHDIFGNYASKVWEYTGRWVDPDILRLITGTYGFVIKPEYLSIRFGLKWDSGSQFIESITRQNNIQYLLQACPPGDPTINRAYLLEELLKEWKFKNVKRIVNDGGQDEQIMLATDQAIRTYMGYMVMVDPSQDHQIAIKVLTSFLKDRTSVYNTDPTMVANGPKLVQQIQQHQAWIQMQMLQQQQMMQQQMVATNPSVLQPLQNQQAPSPGTSPATPGQARQQTGQ